jgi:hypothetical protein
MQKQVGKHKEKIEKGAELSVKFTGRRKAITSKNNGS